MIFFNRDLCYVNIFWTATGDNFNKFSTTNAVNLDLDLDDVVFLASWFRLFMSTFISAILPPTRVAAPSCWSHSDVSSWHNRYAGNSHLSVPLVLSTAANRRRQEVYCWRSRMWLHKIFRKDVSLFLRCERFRCDACDFSVAKVNQNQFFLCMRSFIYLITPKD